MSSHFGDMGSWANPTVRTVSPSGRCDWGLVQCLEAHEAKAEEVPDAVDHVVRVAHIVVVLWVKLAKLCSNSLSGHDTTRPCLQSDY